MDSTRVAIVLAMLAAAVVAVTAANTTAAPVTIGDITLGDVIAQLEKAEALVHAKMTAGWQRVMDNFSDFVIAGPLFEGTISGESITCPWHLWRFSLRTGARVDEPGPRLRCCEVHLDPEGTLRLAPPTGGRG